VVERVYRLGIKPDWWKLEPQASEDAWLRIEDAITKGDPYCRGVVMLGLDAPEAELRQAFAVASGVGIVRGFAIGRTIFADPAERWLAGRLVDEEAVAEMGARFRRLCDAWDQAAAQRRAA
jgi:5-dehydro-2-deoxygluconokinase